jgi:vancomycin permeability regulator SanA
VSPDKIILDGKGYSTYESVYNAVKQYGAKKIVIVTQEYHLYRALYIAEGLGIEAYGVHADLRSYRNQVYRTAREQVARVKDFILTVAKNKD